MIELIEFNGFLFCLSNCPFSPFFQGQRKNEIKGEEKKNKKEEEGEQIVYPEISITTKGII